TEDASTGLPLGRVRVSVRRRRPPVPLANGSFQVGGGSPTLRCLRCGYARKTTSVQPIANELEAGQAGFSRPLPRFRGREDAPVVTLDAFQQLDKAFFLGSIA